MLLITTYPQEENYSIEVSLEGVSYVLSFLWNARCEAFFISMAGVDGTKLISGTKLVADTPLFSNVRAGPPGALVVFDSSGERRDPGKLELGKDKRCQLYYITAEEVALMKMSLEAFVEFVDAST